MGQNTKHANISFERSFRSGTEMFLKCPKMAFNGKTGKVDCLSFLGVSPGSRTCSAADAHVDWMQSFFLRLCQTWLCEILTRTCILHCVISIHFFGFSGSISTMTYLSAELHDLSVVHQFSVLISHSILSTEWQPQQWTDYEHNVI